MALPVENKPTRGKRIETFPIDDWCSMSKEEFERIIDEFIKIPLN